MGFTATPAAVRARAVVANVNPQMLFQTLVPQDAVPAAAANDPAASDAKNLRRGKLCVDMG